ncbi:hypothetical protein CHS0354_022897 [Potamilus streckersoni]|uniref:Uncharacterized protein n=1 Tax=Potamilus streckersoni TaxID=2493646 RepID=A0AAE0S1W6_9BIVA|nr:hypothetical protein CHS0354_022897 [Potamilus streckersoni]
MWIPLLIVAVLGLANALSTTPNTPTGSINNAGIQGRTAELHPAAAWNSLITRNQMTGERSSGATASHADTNPMAQILSSLLSLDGSGTGGGSGGSGNVGGLGSLFGGGHADMNPTSQLFTSMFNLGGSGTGGGSGGSNNVGGLGSLLGGGHADLNPMSQMFNPMFNLGGSGTSGGSGSSSNLGGLGSLFGGGGNSLQNMALLGTGTDQLLNLAGMDCMMNSASPSTATDPACMMLMMQQMTAGI